MARRSSDGDEEADVVRWQKLVELGPERGLCEAGLSQENIDKVLSFVDRELLAERDAREKLSDIEDGMAMLLVFYGRRSQRKRCSFDLRPSCPDVQMSKIEATAFCVNLASNTNIIKLWISGHSIFGRDQTISALFGNALKTSSTLYNLRLSSIDMGSEAVRCVVDGVRASKTLQHLDLSENPLLDKGIQFVADFLCSNTSLHSLHLQKNGYGFEGADLLSYALSRNATLKKLSLGQDEIGRDGMKKLLEPLCWDPTISPDGPRNTTLNFLTLAEMNRESFCVDSVARMIKVNKTLFALEIPGTHLDAEDWTGKIFPALEENKTLEDLDLRQCNGLDSEEVRSAFISLIYEGKIGSEEIELQTDDPDWDDEVKREIWARQKYRDKLSGLSMAEPDSRRIVLCGREFAGKTTLRNTMERAVEATSWLGVKSNPLRYRMACHERRARAVQGTRWYPHFNMACDGVMRTFLHLRQLLFGTKPTRGFDVLAVKEKPLPRTSMWDFAGRKKYHSLYDYMFPNAKNSYFLYVSSCRCPPTDSNLYGEVKTVEEMKADCSFWLRFIASNSKLNQVAESEDSNGDVELPHVKFVLTNIDTLVAGIERVNAIELAENVVAELREEFKSVIHLSGNVAAVDAYNDADVKHLILEEVCSKLHKVVRKQKVCEVCKDAQSALDAWLKTDESKPVVSFDEFHKICQKQKGLTLDREVLEGVLAYLNDMGDVICRKGLDLIVVKPRFFGTDILCYLVDAFEGESDPSQRSWISDCIFGHSKGPSPPEPPNNGIITRDYIQRLLDYSVEKVDIKQTIDMSVDGLVQLLSLLEICFEEEPGSEDSRLFLPALFDHKEVKAGRGERKLDWSTRGGELIYFGRRLQCEDKPTTFLTPGFFPRLQVHLLQYIQRKHWTKCQGFEMGRNLIRFTENGKDICIEYSGDEGYFIDIMVRASKPYADALQFIEEHVIKKIHLFCASPQGHQGVELVEAVVRPACVQHLTVCAARKAHSVLVSYLREKVQEDPEYEYTWEHNLPNVSQSTDFALDLLGPLQKV